MGALYHASPGFAPPSTGVRVAPAGVGGASRAKCYSQRSLPTSLKSMLAGTSGEQVLKSNRRDRT